MQKISTVIITFNEEKNIGRCLKTVIPFSDEIVVVDSNSTDRTVEIAKRFTDKIYYRKPVTIIDQINYATSLAENDWVFCIDADERVTEKLQKMIIDLKTSGFAAEAYSVNRLNYYINGFFRYCGWYPDRKIRLFRKNSGSWGGAEPHYEVILERGAKVKLLECDLIHFTYRNIDHQIDKMNRFSSQAANVKARKNDPLIVLRIILHPLIRFIKTYFFQLGFLGGVRGLANAVIVSFYVFCKYIKIWEAHNKKDQSEIDRELFGE